MEKRIRLRDSCFAVYCSKACVFYGAFQYSKDTNPCSLARSFPALPDEHKVHNLSNIPCLKQSHLLMHQASPEVYISWIFRLILRCSWKRRMLCKIRKKHAIGAFAVEFQCLESDRKFVNFLQRLSQNPCSRWASSSAGYRFMFPLTSMFSLGDLVQQWHRIAFYETLRRTCAWWLIFTAGLPQNIQCALKLACHRAQRRTDKQLKVWAEIFSFCSSQTLH